MPFRLWRSREKHAVLDAHVPRASSSSSSSRDAVDRFSIIEDIGDMDGQKKCHGCKQLRILLEVKKRNTMLPPHPQVFHASFASLDKCAQHCVSCRVFRQALVLERVMSGDAADLEHVSGAVSAQLVPAPGGFAMKIRITDNNGRVPVMAMVRCEAFNNNAAVNLPHDPGHETLYSQVKAWLRNCERCHIDCGNLAFSDRKPTRLLRIISDTHAQLINSKGIAPEKLLYTALSYCWGFKPDVATGSVGELSTDEDETVRRGRTLSSNLKDRYEPFPIATLPGTVRDAIKITARLSNPRDGLELRHIWIDTLCIIQDDPSDKAVEIQRMQEVYGNAILTICATATSKATQPLLRPRLAWAKPVRPCRVGDTWLTVSSTPAADLRPQAALARRAWTLQEQHLSPRLLFWSGQQLSWACAYGEYAETASSSNAPTGQLAKVDNFQGQSAFRHFLTVCRAPEASQLCLAWHEMVESYTARKLTVAADRFPALSGLATRYLAAASGDVYMAGLWRDTFAQDLLWLVSQPASSPARQSSIALAPSWSWASAPIGSPVQMSKQFHMRSELELLDNPSVARLARLELSSAVAQGAELRRVRIKAPIRRFWGAASRPQVWDQICVRVDGVDKFRFTTPGQDVHAVDRRTARVVASEARKQEVVAQLDDTAYAVWADQGLVDIYCLAVSDVGMLLVAYHKATDTYQRIGASLRYRSDFFRGAERREIVLE